MTLSGSRSEEEEEATSTTLMHLFLKFQLFIASVEFLLFWYIHGEVNKNLPRDCYILYFIFQRYLPTPPNGSCTVAPPTEKQRGGRIF